MTGYAVPSGRPVAPRTTPHASQLRRSNLSRSGTLMVSTQGRAATTSRTSPARDSALRGTSSTETRDLEEVIERQSLKGGAVRDTRSWAGPPAAGGTFPTGSDMSLPTTREIPHGSAPRHVHPTGLGPDRSPPPPRDGP